MLFNSLEYAVFLPIVFLLYWFVFNRSYKYQNWLILAASYLFYGWWDWRFLSLLFISSISDYLIGILMAREGNKKRRRWLLYASLAVNLGILGFFKYFNFFVGSFAELISAFGLNPNLPTLQIILPVGISFYTFQTLSYTVDIYRDKIRPTTDIVAFFCYVSFFPQLVAGPIERAGRLLPQFLKPRVFDYTLAKDGLRLILWGLFKKIAIADNCARVVDQAFNNFGNYSGSTLVLGVIFFGFQLYADFSGYSDIAIGSARLFGFRLMRNFKYPFLATHVEDFWRRWHISLTTWIRDYIFLSLPIRKAKSYQWQYIRNIFVVFFFIGLWHGPKWTFIFWGLSYFFLILGEQMLKRYLNYQPVTIYHNRTWPRPREVFQVGVFFILNMALITMFRANGMRHLYGYWYEMMDWSAHALGGYEFYKKIPLLIVIIIWEWIKRDKWHVLDFETAPRWIRWLIYFTLISFIFYHFGGEKPFVYFQF